MRIVKLTEETKNNLMNDLLKRSPNNYSQYEATVNEIIENVRVNKNQAIFEYTRKFDRFELNSENIKVTELQEHGELKRLVRNDHGEHNQHEDEVSALKLKLCKSVTDQATNEHLYDGTAK